jgi:PhnB protein
MKTKPIPDGYHTTTPYLIAKEATKAIDFYKQFFGAKEKMRMPGPGGKIMHAELILGDSMIMLADEFPEMGAVSPAALGGTPVSLLLYVEDVDGVVARAVAAGAKLLRPIQNQFYGDRSGTLEDPFGHKWTVATHVEDVSEEEMGRRMAAMKNC